MFSSVTHEQSACLTALEYTTNSVTCEVCLFNICLNQIYKIVVFKT